jgi:hypothetical protein
MLVESIVTGTTCGEACWSAREEICRCSCGGKNHGCLKTKDGVRPTRQAKIDGVRYELKAIGYGPAGIHKQAREINRAAPKRKIGTYEYHWSESDKGAPARVKTASKLQAVKWPEVAAVMADPSSKGRFYRPYLLWVRVEEIAPVKGSHIENRLKELGEIAWG